MDSFLQRFSDIIKGTLSGFDRIVFKGGFRHLMFAKGVSSFLCSKGVLNKDYKEWMTTQSQAVVRSAQELALDRTGEPIRPFKADERKEETAHRAQAQRGSRRDSSAYGRRLNPAIRTRRATMRRPASRRSVPVRRNASISISISTIPSMAS